MSYNKTKLLVISQYFTPDITAAAYRISETVSGIVESGMDVRVITSTPHKSSTNNLLNEKEKNVIRIKIPFYKRQTKTEQTQTNGHSIDRGQFL